MLFFALELRLNARRGSRKCFLAWLSRKDSEITPVLRYTTTLSCFAASCASYLSAELPGATTSFSALRRRAHQPALDTEEAHRLLEALHNLSSKVFQRKPEFGELGRVALVIMQLRLDQRRSDLDDLHSLGCNSGSHRHRERMDGCLGSAVAGGRDKFREEDLGVIRKTLLCYVCFRNNRKARRNGCDSWDLLASLCHLQEVRQECRGQDKEGRIVGIDFGLELWPCLLANQVSML